MHTHCGRVSTHTVGVSLHTLWACHYTYCGRVLSPETNIMMDFFLIQHACLNFIFFVKYKLEVQDMTSNASSSGIMSYVRQPEESHVQTIHEIHTFPFDPFTRQRCNTCLCIQLSHKKCGVMAPL